MENFDFQKFGKEENEIKECLRRIVKSLKREFPQDLEDSKRKEDILKKDVESLTPRDFELIWRYAEPFSHYLDKDRHPRDPSYIGIHINTIREISRIVVCLFANHALEKNPVWESYLANTRWALALETLVTRNVEISINDNFPFSSRLSDHVS
jgi:hypothetical protein